MVILIDQGSIEEIQCTLRIQVIGVLAVNYVRRRTLRICRSCGMYTILEGFKKFVMIINSVSHLRTLMEEVFCKMHSSVNIDISRKLAEDWVISIVDNEIEMLEEMIISAEAIKELSNEKTEHDDMIMGTYYSGVKGAYNARIRRYKSRITHLKKIKEEFYAKRI
jgi:hypothetical protein